MQRAAVAGSPLGGSPRVQKSSFDDLDIVGSILKVDVKLLYIKYQALIVDTIVARAFKLHGNVARFICDWLSLRKLQKIPRL